MSESLLPEYEIRDLRSDEYPLLEEFLYEDIFVPADFVGEVPRTLRQITRLSTHAYARATHDP